MKRRIAKALNPRRSPVNGTSAQSKRPKALVARIKPAQKSLSGLRMLNCSRQTAKVKDHGSNFEHLCRKAITGNSLGWR